MIARIKAFFGFTSKSVTAHDPRRCPKCTNTQWYNRKDDKCYQCGHGIF